MRTDFKKAIDAYLISDEGCAACDPTTLRAPEQNRQYLENRLKEAFTAGWNASFAVKPSDSANPVGQSHD